MAFIYPTLTETINKTTFEVRMSDQIEFTVPKYYRDNPHLHPIFVDEEEHSLSFITINNIIQLCTEGHPFVIVKRSDVVLICQLLTDYTKELSRTISPGPFDNGRNDETDQRRFYLGKCKATLSLLQSHNARAEREEDVINNAGKPKSISSIMESLAKFLG